MPHTHVGHSPRRTAPARDRPTTTTTTITTMRRAAAAPEAPPSATVRVHRCRFVDYVPDAVHGLAFSPSGERLAVARANADIELWNVGAGWTQELRLPGGQDRSVEALVWANETRMLSAGLDGFVTEWNLDGLCERRTCASYGGAIWTMAPSHGRSAVAVGCEDGGIRLLSIADDRLEYTRTLADRQNGRILSVAWQPGDEWLVAGDADSTICRYHVASGRALLFIGTERVARDPTLVWCVAALRDGTVIGADSLGTLQFWSCEHGTLLQSLRLHDADILAMAVDEDDGNIYTAGVDNKVVQYSRVAATAGRWIFTSKTRVHTHDVRALALSGPPRRLLVSAGIDTQLVVYSSSDFARGHLRKLVPFPQGPCASLARVARILMFQHSNKLQLWRLGEAAADAGERTPTADGVRLQPDQPPALLLELRSKQASNIVCSALSTDARWIAYSDATTVRVFYAPPSESVRAARGVRASGRVARLIRGCGVNCRRTICLHTQVSRKCAESRTHLAPHIAWSFRRSDSD